MKDQRVSSLSELKEMLELILSQQLKIQGQQETILSLLTEREVDDIDRLLADAAEMDGPIY